MFSSLRVACVRARIHSVVTHTRPPSPSPFSNNRIIHTFTRAHTHSGPHADALLWAGGEDASDPCRHFYLQACAFLGNVVTCNDYAADEEEEEGEQGQGQEQQGHHHISFAGRFFGLGFYHCA